MKAKIKYSCSFLCWTEIIVCCYYFETEASLPTSFHKYYLLCFFFFFLQLYQPFLETQESMLLELDQRIKGSKLFEELFKEFESQKVCYLPLNTFFLKPGQRLLHYKLVLERKYLYFYFHGSFFLFWGCLFNNTLITCAVVHLM